jgi:hypothetical protein
MKMRIVLILAVSSVCNVTGCTHGGLILVPNPGAALTSPAVPIATVKITPGLAPIPGVTSVNSPSISVYFANGEAFKGRLISTLVSSAKKNIHYSQSSAPPHPNLSDDWDAIYGKGYFFSHYGKTSLDSNGSGAFYQAILAGSRGTTLQIEVGGGADCTPNGADSKDPFGYTCQWEFDGTGVAIDDKGNVYKYLDRQLMTHRTK